jgi:hypothetical protein
MFCFEMFLQDSPGSTATRIKVPKSVSYLLAENPIRDRPNTKRYTLDRNKDTKSLVFLINSKSRLKVQRITTERSRFGIADTSG